ncbi:MAG: hypothetical protein LBG98_00980 [Puniceicoccales bacterium]|jgi:dihydrofolate synthase/folylpolyglutamate synthase|nr:hypothetical protein [Puniceicoccales bacterium]
MDFPDLEKVIHFLDHRPVHRHYSTKGICHLLEETQTIRLPSHVIHVAGTNGKGSVCAILAHVYRQAGYSVGFYSSPHLVDIRERIQISGQYISKKDFLEHFSKIHEIAEQWESEDSENFISHFEYLTAMALSFFKEKCPDIVLLETGMGGRHDATTATVADTTVITTIHYDHQCHLGQTLGEIAHEKAGILLPHVPLLVGNIPEEAFNVIQKQAHDLGVPMIPSRAFGIDDETWRRRYAPLPLYQRDNMATACSVVQWLQKKFPLSSQIWAQASSQFYWPCRWERFYNEMAGEMILDGAHNLEGAQAILREIENHRANGTPFQQLIFGSIEMDRARHMLALLVPHFEEVFLVISGYERHLSGKDFHSCIPENFRARIQMITLEQAGNFLAKKKKILITGSLYMLGSLLTSYRPLWRSV